MDPQLSLVCLDNNIGEITTTLRPATSRPATSRPATTTASLPKISIDDSLLKCGKASPEAQHPWQVQIKVLTNRISKHLCSGVILTEKHILTSASCLINNPLKHYIVVVGQNDLDELDEWEEEFSVQSIFTHDLFNEVNGEHDIALVKLKQRRGAYINFSPYVQPICLPTSGSGLLNDLCQVSGWGSYSQSSQSSMSLMGQSVNIDPVCTQLNYICVENPNAISQKDFVFDDGMPLSCKGFTQRSYLQGLHAMKIDPCTEGCPRMKFLRLSDYLDWINARLAL